MPKKTKDHPTTTNQIYPKVLDDYILYEKIEYNTIILKKDYFVDLIHILLFKYRTTKKNRYHLSSSVLRKRYGKHYNYYLKFLIDNSLINLEKNYQKGRNARLYSLSDKIIQSQTITYANTNKNLFKKRKKIKQESIFNSNSPIPVFLREKLIDSLYSFSFDFSLADNILKLDINNEIKNKWLIDIIRDKNLFYHFDSWGRMHTPFTILPKVLRKHCLSLDNEKIHEIDLSNSQVLFLKVWLEDNHPHLIGTDEFEHFQYLVDSGVFYDFFSEKLNTTRKKSKVYFYEFIFGKYYESKSSGVFKGTFPLIYDVVIYEKIKNKNYKFFSAVLQKMESDFIYGKVVNEIWQKYPHIKLTTIHDSIICKDSEKSLIEEIFYKNLSKIKKELKNNI